MLFSWTALRADCVRRASRHSFQTEFQTLKRGDPVLCRFADPAALLDHLHDSAQSCGEKNNILRALLESRGAGYDDIIDTLMVLALWPGLSAAYGRLSRHFPGDRPGLALEIATQFTMAVRNLRLDRVNAVAATLIRNVERDIKRAAFRERTLAGMQVELNDDNHPVAFQDTEQGTTPHQRFEPVSDLDCRLRGVVGADADLVVSVAILGRTQAEAASDQGISPAAARKRYQRAITKLRADWPLAQSGVGQ